MTRYEKLRESLVLHVISNRPCASVTDPGALPVTDPSQMSVIDSMTMSAPMPE